MVPRPPVDRKDQTPPPEPRGAVVWTVVKEIGGVPIVVAVIIFAARLDANVQTFAKAAEKLAGAIEQLTAQQRAQDKAIYRDSLAIAEHDRRLRELEEARRAARR